MLCPAAVHHGAERPAGGQSEWLLQWNDNWEAFFFVGGHKHDDESFRKCVIREVEEELGLSPAEFTVEPQPTHRLEYRAVSRSAGELTDYVMELFPVQPTAAALEKVMADRQNAWISTDEIRRLETRSGRPVSVSAQVLLGLSGRL